MIFELLSEGKENATPATELMAITGADRRSIVAAVERERREGRPICASCDPGNYGYFLPKDAEELEAYCKQLKSRATNLFKTRQALINVLKQISEQQS